MIENVKICNFVGIQELILMLSRTCTLATKQFARGTAWGAKKGRACSPPVR